MKWPTATLDDLVTIVGGGTPSKKRPEFYTGTIPWVSPKDMKAWEIYDSEDHITENALASSTTNLVEPGVVLVVIRSGVLKHTLPVAINRVPVAINQDMKALRCGPRVHAEYLARALKWASRGLLTTVRGTTADNISTDVLRRVEIPIPPLSEQKRIATILDKADAVRRKRRRALELTRQFLRSTFLDMFGDPVRNPKGWRDSRLGTVADIQSGVTKGRRFGGRETVSIPYMRVANVQDGHILLNEVKEIEVLRDEIQRFRLLPGDVLLTEGGDFDKLGRGAVWRGEIDPCIHQNHIFRVRPMPDIVLPEFLSALLGSGLGKRYFLQAAKQTTGIATINKTQLSRFPTLLPPLPLQEKYEALVGRHDQLTARIEEQFRVADCLFDALLQRAFRGEL